jgi:hypothetical protein
MVKVVLHLNASAPLPPNSSSASPGLVPVVRLGVRCLDHPPGPSWSEDGVAMAAYDEPAASGVAPPADVAPLSTGVAPPPPRVAPLCGCVC